MSKCILYRKIAESSQLPNVCMQCGKEATLARKKEFSWFPSWIYFLIPFGLLPFIIIVMMSSYRMKLMVPFCENHRGHFFFRTLVGLGGFLSLIGVFILVMVLFQEHEQIRTIMASVVGCLGLAWLFANIYLIQTAIRPIEIDKNSMTLVNVNRAFVDVLNNKCNNVDQQSIMPKITTEPPQKTTFGGAIAQILLLGFAASVLVNILSAFIWASVVQKQGYPFEYIQCLQLIALVIIGVILLAIKGTTRWSHLGTFGVLFCSLCLTTLLLFVGGNQQQKKEKDADWSDRKMMLTTMQNYVNSATICLTQFESVTNKETAEQAIRMLYPELSSLGGTVRSFSWQQNNKDTSDLAKEAESSVQKMNKRLKAAIEKAKQKAHDHISFQELCDRYLQLVGRIERKEHLNRQ